MKIEITRERSYQTIMVLALAALLIGWWKDISWLQYVSMGLLFVSLISGWVADKLTWLWLSFSEILGKIMPKIFLSIVFFIFLTPLAFVFRLFKKDFMNLKKKESGSYFTERNHTYTASDISKPW